MISNPKHEHEHHNHSHDHSKRQTWWDKIASALHLPGYAHSHVTPGKQDALFRNELGVRTVKQALLILSPTTVLQVVIYVFSQSVALLADTVHNLGDALNSIPLLIAFLLARRAATRRYTYGYGGVEDIAGLLIVLSILFSAGYILYEAFGKILNPELIQYGGWVVLASVIGFLGNEAVASLQIRVGNQIGSEAMITDGRHARVDGLTSLAIIPAVIGSWLGWPILDPIFGLLIGIAILFITWDSIKAMWYRLLDAVDPDIVEHAELSLKSIKSVGRINSLRMRWVGHSLHLVAEVELAPATPIERFGEIRQQAVDALKQNVPLLDDIVLSIIPG